MQAVSARADITPQVGVELTAFIAREGTSPGTRVPLLFGAPVVEDASVWAALAARDLIGLGRNLV